MAIFVHICSYCSYTFVYIRHWGLFHQWSSLTHGWMDLYMLIFPLKRMNLIPPYSKQNWWEKYTCSRVLPGPCDKWAVLISPYLMCKLHILVLGKQGIWVRSLPQASTADLVLPHFRYSKCRCHSWIYSLGSSIFWCKFCFFR